MIATIRRMQEELKELKKKNKTELVGYEQEQQLYNKAIELTRELEDTLTRLETWEAY